MEVLQYRENSSSPWQHIAAIKGEKGDKGDPGDNYTLPTASSSILGGIKVGENLTIENGVLSAQAGGYSPPEGGIPNSDLASKGDAVSLNGYTIVESKSPPTNAGPKTITIIT